MEVFHRVHPSVLLMMHTCHRLWGVSSNKKSITQQMTLSWTGTPPVALAEEKLILPLLTMDQSKMCKENMNLCHVWHFFERLFGPRKLIFWRVKCNVVQTTPIVKMMFDTWRKKVPWERQSAKRRG